jgi:tripartite-type tricarboxylate transporter receptor subunit TctC
MQLSARSRISPASGRSRATRAARFPLVILLSILAASLWPVATRSSDGGDAFPAATVTIIVGFAPGGPTDFSARVVAEELTKVWKQPVIIDNRPGGNSIPATRAAIAAPPNGLTLFMGAGNHTTNPAIKKVPYDTARALAPVVLVSETPNVILVNNALPVRTLPELIAYLKQHPGELNYASSGVGGTVHLAAELFMQLTGTKIVHIPYKGAAPAMIDVIGGHAHLSFPSLTSAMSLVNARMLRVVAVMSAHRIPYLPDVPTAAEQGLDGLDIDTWYGLLAPVGTPEPVLVKIRADVNAVLAMPEVAERMRAQGMRPTGGTGEDMQKLIEREINMWMDLARKIGLKQQE